MWTPTRLSPLDEFASAFIADIDDHTQVRSEALASAVRSRYDLPPFPGIDDLRVLCGALGIPLWNLPAAVPETWGTNFAYGDEVHIGVQSGLRLQAQESTIVHEIREALENAFHRVKPAYVPLSTHDNRQMNGVSDRFAGYMLMETDASRALLRELGFDFAEFARRTGRSLPAVLLRLQQLFPASAGSTPVIGTWLFDADWPRVESRQAQLTDLEARYAAKLHGFTQRKGKMTGQVFPRIGSRLADFSVLREAVRRERPCSATITGMGLLPDTDYLVLAEPILPRGVPWRMLVTAVRLDGVPDIAPLLARLRPDDLGERPQGL
ncbi:MAG: hypothetical protein FJ104_07945 [Deltaproteobacteria bacterium]|nr:hypothetical protein [Deltaproteobacteria bacterium]